MAHPQRVETLDIRPDRLKIPPIREQAPVEMRLSPDMNSTHNPSISKRPPEPIPMEKPCKHPRVRVVAREEDAEFVECQECGDVFESSEFKDMAIEENIRPEEA
jgi:hypothetical protein